MTGRAEELERHEQELYRLLDELGKALGQRERLFDRERRHRNRVRLEQITEEARRPFEALDQDTLVEGLEREIQHQRGQERELGRVLDVLRLQRRLEDRLFEELKRHIADEHRDELFGELEKRFERRERIFEATQLTSLQETRKRISEGVNCQRGLEQLLFKVIERHLIRMHQSQGRP